MVWAEAASGALLLLLAPGLLLLLAVRKRVLLSAAIRYYGPLLFLVATRPFRRRRVFNEARSFHTLADYPSPPPSPPPISGRSEFPASLLDLAAAAAAVPAVASVDARLGLWASDLIFSRLYAPVSCA